METHSPVKIAVKSSGGSRDCAVSRDFGFWLVAAVAAVVFAAVSARANDGGRGAGDEPLSPYFQVRGAEPGVDALPLKSTEVDATLAGVIAEVRVVQTYQNEGGTPLEARYIFPGSTRAAVHGMTMTVGGRRIEAQVKEKEEARKTYEVAKREGKTASLLESSRSNVFEMNVANILPGDTVRVELRYNELLVPADGEYEWVFPTVVGPRYTRGGEFSIFDSRFSIEGAAAPDANGSGSSPIENRKSRIENPPSRGGAEYEPVFALNAEIVAPVPVRAVECVSHCVRTSGEGGADGAGGRVRVTLPPGGDGAPVMNRDFILRYRLTGDALAGGLMIDEWNGEKFFLLTVQPPARVTPALVPPRDYVFVMDVSGSMWGFPLDVSTRLLEELLVSLHEADTFNVQLFSGSSRMLFDGPVAATPENIAAALALFEAGRKYGDYGGATELLPALERVLSLPARPGVSRSIVVVTDGYVDVEAEAYALVRARLGEANLFAFGIGAAVNRELIERLARAGRSEPAVVDGKDRAAAAAAKFRRMIEAPVLTHVRTAFEGFSTGELIPAAQPDVLAQRPVMMVGKWHGAATGKVRLSGLTGAGAWNAEIDVADAVRLDGSGALAHLWARERLTGLEDLHAIRFEADRQKAEIVRLGLKYNLLTRFTSFVAVDTTPREVRERAEKVTQPNPLPAGVSERAPAGGEVPTSPEPGTVSLMIVAALIVGWSVWRKRRGTRAEANGG